MMGTSDSRRRIRHSSTPSSLGAVTLPTGAFAAAAVFAGPFAPPLGGGLTWAVGVPVAGGLVVARAANQDAGGEHGRQGRPDQERIREQLLEQHHLLLVL